MLRPGRASLHAEAVAGWIGAPAFDPARLAKGVVDGYGRVHGIENLHVVGSSVFPTSGWANPTLTIVALALRTADRIAGTG